MPSALSRQRAICYCGKALGIWKAHTENVCSCYSVFVLKNVTVTMPEDLALWARRRAADEDCSVSKLLCKLVEKERARGDSSKLAHEAWKNRVSLDIDADQRMSREEAHERR